jgi:hypothetical protein
MIGITREQGVQKSGSASWQTDNKERFLDLLTRDFWENPAVALNQESITQGPKQVGTESEFSNEVEAALCPARFDQTGEGFQKIVLAEIVQSTMSLSSSDQIF